MMVDKADKTTLAAEERLLGHLAREEAKRRATAEGGSTLEAIMARVSAEVTRAAKERKEAQMRQDRQRSL
jgi:hypothetical protein